MSPRNGILVGARRPRAAAPISPGAAACAAFLLALTFGCRAAAAAVPAVARAVSDGDLRRAEKVLAKLRLLHDVAAADDAAAFRTLASKFYPDLFVKVAELHPGDLSTDLSTAVFLAERLGRTWSAAGAAADCRSERPDIYLPLCLNLRGGTVRQLLLAKSRLHARWAEAVLRNNSGVADAGTAHALAEIEAARANDLLIAARVVETLKTLEGRYPFSAADAARGLRFNASATGFDKSDGEGADALRVAGDLLSWMPRSQTFYHLSGARLAYADGLSWYRKVRQSTKLVVSAASGFDPGPLKVLKLDAEQVGDTVRANRKSAVRHTRLAEQSLSLAAR